MTDAMADTVGFILQLVCNIYQTVQRAQRNKKELKGLEETIRQQVEPLLRQVQQARSTCSQQVQQALDNLHTSMKRSSDFVAGKGQMLDPYEVKQEIAAVEADLMAKVHFLHAALTVSIYRDMQDVAELVREVKKVADQLSNAWKSGKGAYRQLTDQLRSGAASARDSIKSGAANALDTAAKASKNLR